jgi:nucleoside-diphosphate-sugar epimerase
MNKVLILGDGLLGSELVTQTNWDYISRKKDNITLDNIINNTKLLVDYNVIVNCIANTDSYSKNKENHLEVNYKFPILLSNLCNNNNKKLVHISTDFVYANNPNIPTEEDLPLPDNNWYAYTKLLADEYIKITNTNYLICRLSHKPNPFPYPEVWDIKTNGDTVDKISELVIKLINNNANGIYNVGTKSKSLKEIAPNSKVILPPEYVPKDTRMNLNKLKNFLYEMDKL